nr:hypothetical protein [Candidatus Sigynarchaeota archaeon]
MAISWEIPVISWLIAAPCVAFLVVYRKKRREFAINGIVLVIVSAIFIMLGISVTASNRDFDVLFLLGALLFLTGVLGLQLGLTRHPSRFNWIPAIAPPIILVLLCLASIQHTPDMPTLSFLFIVGLLCSVLIPICWWNEKKKAITLEFRPFRLREAVFAIVHIAEITAILVSGFAVFSLQVFFGDEEIPNLNIVLICSMLGFLIVAILAQHIYNRRKRERVNRDKGVNKERA